MDVLEVQTIAREFAPAVSDYVARALQPMLWRLDAIERRLDTLPGARDGRDGRDVDPADIERLVERAVSRLVLPPGPPGDPGRDGKDAEIDIEELHASVQTEVHHAIAELPRPRDGKDAEPISSDEIVRQLFEHHALINGAVQKAVSAIPAPKDGAPGNDGRDGAPGADGTSVTLDDVTPLVEASVAKAMEAVTPQDVSPEMVAPMIRAETDMLRRALQSEIERLPDFVAMEVAEAVARASIAGRDGKDGADGKDGIDGKDGASVSVADLRDEIERQIASSAVAELPTQIAAAMASAPREPDTLTLSMMVKAAAENAVAALPPPERGPQGEPGRDVDPAEVEAMLSKAVAALPPPKDGEPGRDGRDGLDGAVGEPGPQGDPGPAGKDGESIKGNVGEPGPAGDPGRDGQDADMAALEARIDATLKQAIAGLPAPARGEKGEPGADGRDGADADQEALQARLREAVSEAVAALPPAEPGRDGRDGIDGRDGKDAEIDQAAIDAVIQKAIEALPKPERGERGPQGERGERGEMGATGVGVAGAVIDRDGLLVLTLSDGTTKALSKVVGADGVSIDPMAVAAMVEREVGKIPLPKDGRDGIDGKDGANGRDGIDGFGFDDMEFVQDGDRRAFLRFTQGDRVKEFIVGLPGQIYRGVWKPDIEYVRGDTVTWGGSLFVVQKDNPDGKPEASQDFKLAVKRGRDGKDGKDGRPGEKGIPGAEGRPGRDGISYPQA